MCVVMMEGPSITIGSFTEMTWDLWTSYEIRKYVSPEHKNPATKTDKPPSISSLTGRQSDKQKKGLLSPSNQKDRRLYAMFSVHLSPESLQ